MKRRISAITPLVFACVLAACGGDSEISSSTGDPIQTSVAYTTIPLIPSTPSPSSTPLSTAPPPTAGTDAPTTVLQTTTTTATNGGSSTALQTTTTVGETPSGLPTEICLSLMQAAMNEGDPADYIEAYYPPLADCTGLDDWLAAVEETGFDAGEDPIEWAANVCALDGPIIKITCQEAIATAQAG